MFGAIQHLGPRRREAALKDASASAAKAILRDATLCVAPQDEVRHSWPDFQRGTKRGRKSLIPLVGAGKITAECGADVLTLPRIACDICLVIPDGCAAADRESSRRRSVWIPGRTFGPPGMTKSLLRRHRRHRHVVQHRPEPPLHFTDVHALARRIVLDLVALDLGDAEVMRVGMSDVDAAHR